MSEASLDGGTPGATAGVRGVGGLLDLRATVTLGLFFAWQGLLVDSTLPGEGVGAVPPQLALALAAFLAMVGCLRAQLGARAGGRGLVRRQWGGTAVVLGTLACAVGLLFPSAVPVRYGCAVVAGAAMAPALLALVTPVAGLAPRPRLGSLLAGCALSFLAQGMCHLLPQGLPSSLLAVVLGGGTALALSAWGAGGGPQTQEASYRPTRDQHYRLLMAAMIIYAFVFGSVAGSSAHQATASSAQVLGEHSALAGLLVSMACLALLACVRAPVRLEAVGRVLTPLLAVLFLAHIVLPDAGRSWLPPTTLAFWQLVQVFVMLVLVEVSRGGVGSLGLVFAGGWSALAGGFATGSLFGAVSGALFGADEDVVNAITVLHTVLAVVASSLLAAARYPSVGDGGAGVAGLEGAARDGGRTAGIGLSAGSAPASGSAPTSGPSSAFGLASASGPSPASGLASASGPSPAFGPAFVSGLGPSPDAISRACALLAGRHGLSEREGEVLELLARGNTRQSIAGKLVVSENTVRTHVKNIYAKLRIHSKQQLIDMVDGLRG